MNREETAAALVGWVSETFGGLEVDERDVERFVDLLDDKGMVYPS